MAWARFCARVRLRLGIIAVRSPPGSQVVRGWPKRCRGGVGAIKLGNSRALPGVVMQLCPPGSRQITGRPGVHRPVRALTALAAPQLEQLANRRQPRRGSLILRPRGRAQLLEQRTRLRRHRRLPIVMNRTTEHMYCLSA